MNAKKFILIFLFLLNLSYAQTYRDSIDVLHYWIHDKILLNHQFIQGHTKVLLRSKYALNRIQLDLWGFYIDSVLVNGQKQTFKYNSESFWVPYKLPANDTVTVDVYYFGNPMQDDFWGGFYFSKQNAFNYGIGMNSKPLSVGRCWFAANDVFDDKALFDFYITARDKYTAVCNGLLKDTLRSGQFITWHWKLAEPIPTYLASVAVGPYKVRKWIYHGIKANIPVQIYYLKTTPDTALHSFAHLNQVMRIYERLFGPYPWERIGFVQTTMSSGAMEHATNIALPLSSIDGTFRNEPLFYHELAHSWFGDYVTCKTRRDMWLNEGWATYCQQLYQEYLYGEKRFRDYRREKHLYVLNFAHKEDQGYRAIGKIDYIHTYGKTVYDKGADVVHTLRYQIGDSLFWPAVRAYLKKYAYSNASIADFEHSLEQFTGQNLSSFFKFWIYGRGFPWFQVFYTSVKHQKGKYRVAVAVEQRLVGTDTFDIGQKLPLAFVDKNANLHIVNLTVAGQWTYDTIVLNFRPECIVVDPQEHVADATTKQYFLLDTVGNYPFDYELFLLKLKHRTHRKVFAFVQANWLKPGGTFPKNVLVQQNYFWSVRFSCAKCVKADGLFFLTTLMDENFVHLKQDDLKNLILLYRPNMYTAWKPVKFSITQDYGLYVKDLRPGDYAIAMQRK